MFYGFILHHQRRLELAEQGTLSPDFLTCTKKLGIKTRKQTTKQQNSKASPSLEYYSCVRLKVPKSHWDLWTIFCITQELPRNWVTQSCICRVAEMETVIIVPGSEYETSLHCLSQFLELRSKKQAGLSCESIHRWRTLFCWSGECPLFKFLPELLV